MEVPEARSAAKMQLITMVSELMPQGRPAFLEVVKFPMIKALEAEHGRPTLIKVLFLMVKDFCDSLNVIRNMNEDQMIEAAVILLDEADNFRLEDYTMMFSMGKRGELVKILDRVDIQVILTMMNEYYQRRARVAYEVRASEFNNFHLEPDPGPQLGYKEPKQIGPIIEEIKNDLKNE